MKKELHIIGYEHSGSGSETFYSYNPSGNCNNDYLFYRATTAEVETAVTKAATAFQVYRKKTGKEKAAFLSLIAEEILKTGDELIMVCSAETGLPAARLEGERGRTVNQLKLFADLLTEGSWVDARIDTAIPGRVPLPKPDLRYMHISLGPVVVFGASNFPLAFSVAGGDTVSALAAGCSVIVKAHPAHPATSAIVGRAIQAAALKSNMPDGIFSLLFDDGISVGQQLVKHPMVKAVGFTGSYKAGKAIFDAAAGRPEPIPVYAEMGSVNPVFILPQIMKEKGNEIAAAYAGSVTAGVGQFCTNPGVLIHKADPGSFGQLLKHNFEQVKGGVMLTRQILDAYNSGIAARLATDGAQQLATTTVPPDAVNWAKPLLVEANSELFSNTAVLNEELFGPSGVIIPVLDKKEMLDIAAGLTGQLTCTVHGTEEELMEYSDLLNILEQKAGRIIINGFPTGVEVSPAMVHGGPFPATTDNKTTSVGTTAIYRFTRPVCYQDMPQSLLTEELKNNNSLAVYRLVNGKLSKDDIR